MEVSSAEIGGQGQLTATLSHKGTTRLTQLGIKLHKTVEESRAQAYHREAVVQAIRRP
jgi:hypothetical protein